MADGCRPRKSLACIVIGNHVKARTRHEPGCFAASAQYAILILPTSHAGMAELADAADSKSAEVHPSWGFDPPSRHQAFRLVLQSSKNLVRTIRREASSLSMIPSR